MQRDPGKPGTPGLLRPGAVLVLVASIAILVRLVYVLEIHDHLYWLTPQVDAADFHQRAMQVADGLGIGQRVYYKAPAYPWLVGQLYRLVGPSLVALYVLQMLGGVLMTVVVAALGMRWWGPRVGLLAGVLSGACTELAYFENQALIESPALVVSVIAVALLAWSVSRLRGAVNDRSALAGLLVSGALLGLALQLRPINAFLVAGLLAWVVWQRFPWSHRLRLAVFVLVPVLLLLIPTLRHNRMGSGEIILVSANGGINFYIGNNPQYDETVAIRPGLRWEELTRRFGANDAPAQWQRNYYSASWEWMRQNPADYLALLGRKFVLFWNARTIDRNQDSSVMRQESWALRFGIPWGLLSFLGLIGLMTAWSQARRWPLHVAVLSQMVGVLAFFVTTRYRTAVIPWLALAAAWAVVEAIRIVRRGDRRAAAFWGGAALTSLVLVAPDWTDIGSTGWSRPDFDLAQVQLRNGLREEALASYRRAARQRPDDPDVMLWYAEHLERMGHPDEATAAYRKAIELVPSLYKPALSLGATYIERGDLDQAWRWLQEAERRGDDSGRSLYNMALVRERQQRYEEALALHRASLQRDGEPSDRARARLGVARCLLRLGRGAAAQADLRAAAALSRDADFQLDVAAAWVEARQPQEALKILVPRLQASPRPRELALAARAWAQQRRWVEARRAAAAALAADPTSERFQTLLDEIERAARTADAP